MSTTIKSTQVIAAKSYWPDKRIREAISAAQTVLERNPEADAVNLTVVEKKDRYGYGTLTLRFLTEETL